MVEFRKLTNSRKLGDYIALAALCLVLILFVGWSLLTFRIDQAVSAIVVFGCFITVIFGVMGRIDFEWSCIALVILGVGVLFNIVTQ